jgi:hypothetical protein
LGDINGVCCLEHARFVPVPAVESSALAPQTSATDRLAPTNALTNRSGPKLFGNHWTTSANPGAQVRTDRAFAYSELGVSKVVRD